MPTQRNDFLLGMQIGQSLGPLGQAMGQWRDDRIANDLLKTMSAPRAQAVDPSLQAPADARAAAMPVPLPAGLEGSKGLAAQMQLDKAMQERALKTAQLQNVQARTAQVGKPKGTAVDRPPGYWESVTEKNQGNPTMTKYKLELGMYQKERARLESQAGQLQDALGASVAATTQSPIEEIFPLKGAYRANETGATDEKSGKYARLRGANDELITMPWENYQKLLGGHAQLQSMQKRLSAMTPPELPVFEKGSTEESGKQESRSGKALDRETAQRFLQQAGGDKQKARQLARAAGYSF